MSTSARVLGAEGYAKNLPFVRGALAGEEQLFDRMLVDQSGRVRHTQAPYVPDVVCGVVCGFFVLVTDVTPRVEAQRAMGEAQSLAQLGSWTLIPATGEVTWTRELFEILGLHPTGTPPTLVTLAERIHPEDRDRVLANVDHATRIGEAYAIGYRIVRPDGTVREVVSSGRPLANPDGSTVRISGTMQDVTESNATARELRRINSDPRLANQFNSDVIAMLGHDVRSPLTGILGFLELLDEDWGALTQAQRRRLVTRTRSAARRLNAMVSHILALATIDSGTITTQPEQLDLSAVIATIVDGSDMTGKVLVHSATAQPPSGWFDPVHLEEIVGNLLTNAFRYGHEPVQVDIDNEGNEFRVAVTDAGPDVPEAQIGQLFTRFARTGRHQESAGGTVFGLSMASRLAQANGASLIYHPADDDRPHPFVLTVPGGDGGGKIS